MESRASGKFVLRLPPELHAKLRALSQSKGISLNELCRDRLAQASDVKASGEGLLSPGLQNAILSLALPVEALVLFGSRVRGDSTANSDTDLLIVLEAGFPITRELYTLWDEQMKGELAEMNALRLAPHFTSMPETVSECGSLWLEVSLNGIVMWEKHTGSVRGFLFRLREAVAEGRFQRKISHGHPYWVRRGENEE